VERFLVMRVQLILVLALELVFIKVQINRHLLVLLKLHHNEGVTCLSLTQRRVETHDKHVVYFIRLGKYHKLLDSLILNLVIVSFASESEGGFVHVDVETTSVRNILVHARRL
jgi:hypothetical protein